MNPDEDAEIPYDPDNGEESAISYSPDDEPPAAAGIGSALAHAEQQLGTKSGVHGMGMTKTPAGEDAIVVYVEDQQALSQLPATVDGYPIVGEVTGEIRPL